jgi:MFS family permease
MKTLFLSSKASKMSQSSLCLLSCSAQSLQWADSSLATSLVKSPVRPSSSVLAVLAKAYLLVLPGFLAMSDFLARFGQDGKFSAARQGTIVGLLCTGTLTGCLLSGWICDRLGRKWTISSAAFFYIIGVVIEVSSERQWVQFAMGRFTAGIGIGALSTSVPMYQSESVPKNIRGATVSSYQLLITLGIWTAYMVSTIPGIRKPKLLTFLDQLAH